MPEGGGGGSWFFVQSDNTLIGDGTEGNKLKRSSIFPSVTTATNRTLETEYTVFVDTGAGDVTITLPLSASNKDRRYDIKKISSANTLFLAFSGSDTFEGTAGPISLTDFDSWTLQADGITDWWLM